MCCLNAASCAGDICCRLLLLLQVLHHHCVSCCSTAAISAPCRSRAAKALAVLSALLTACVVDDLPLLLWPCLQMIASMVIADSKTTIIVIACLVVIKLAEKLAVIAQRLCGPLPGHVGIMTRMGVAPADNVTVSVN
jgi:hypothetical protein